jgi:DNA polymerase-2
MIVGGDEDDAIEGFKGAKFSRHQVILPEIIQTLWEARDEAKLHQEAALSQAIKIIMNSFYGVLGTSGCRFFDTRLVSSITLRGHEILQKTRDILEARGLNVIYGDTDSVFVLLKNVKNKAEADIQGLAESEYLNQWWRDYLLAEYQIESCLEVEYETYFSRFLMPTVRGSEVGSKKRYAGMVPKNDGFEMVYKGLEAVRSDWSPLARNFQRALYERIFNNEPFEQFVKDTVAEVLAGKWDEHLVLRKRIRRNLSDYQKNVPPHVKAARLEESERQKRGFDTTLSRKPWVEYVMTVNGAEPKRYLKGDVDYQFYIDKQLAPIADAILSFKSTSLAQITDLQLGLF